MRRCSINSSIGSNDALKWICDSLVKPPSQCFKASDFLISNASVIMKSPGHLLGQVLRPIAKAIRQTVYVTIASATVSTIARMSTSASLGPWHCLLNALLIRWPYSLFLSLSLSLPLAWLRHCFQNKHISSVADILNSRCNNNNCLMDSWLARSINQWCAWHSCAICMPWKLLLMAVHFNLTGTTTNVAITPLLSTAPSPTFSPTCPYPTISNPTHSDVRCTQLLCYKLREEVPSHWIGIVILSMA